MTPTQCIQESTLYLRAIEGIPLLIGAIVLLGISAYLIKRTK
jgi:uncharacterized membrane protein